MEVKQTSSFRGLSKETLENALEKIKPNSPSEDWELKLLKEDMYDVAVPFMRDYFVRHEPVVQAFGVEWDDDAEGYWREVFKQGLTLVLINKTDGAVIAIRGLEILNKTDKINTDNISDERLRNLLDYLNYCDEHAKFFEHYGCDEAIHFLGLAVHEAYRQRGIATFMLTSAVNFVKHLGLKSVFVKGEASSNYSKKIYEKLEFDLLF